MGAAVGGKYGQHFAVFMILCRKGILPMRVMMGLSGNRVPPNQSWLLSHTHSSSFSPVSSQFFVIFGSSAPLFLATPGYPHGHPWAPRFQPTLQEAQEIQQKLELVDLQLQPV